VLVEEKDVVSVRLLLIALIPIVLLHVAKRSVMK
jgi:hypothetical protein